MKTLTKVRLINWHYFENETIDIKRSAVFSGLNGSGKSTILDAISFVLTAGDQNFNLAANDKGKRELRSYVKCKLGSTDQEYLRDYDLSGHICLEFFSEKKEKFFCLGVIIDVIGNITAPKVTFYSIDEPMRDEFFINENSMVRSSQDFKKAHFTDDIYQTRKEAKSAFRAKMGGVSDKYFSLIPKAIAFKPIADVKEYIYQQLLEQKEIDVKNIQDSIRSYKEFEGILKTTKAKIADLDKISSNYYAIKEIKENQDFYQYLLKDIKRNDNLEKIENKSKLVQKSELEMEDIKTYIRDIDTKIDMEDDRAKQLYASLSTDKDFRAGELYDRDIKKAENDLKFAIEKRREFDRKILEFEDNVRQIEPHDKELFDKLNKINTDVKSIDQIKTNQNRIDDSLELVNKKVTELATKEATLNIKKNECIQSIQGVYDALSRLSKNEIPYRPEIIQLRSKMEAYLKNRYGEEISVHILAEVIDVKDPEWHDTVENLLAGQRFILIVEPRYYDDCLECYNQNKSRNVSGVNLLDTTKIQSYTSYQPNSLASIITTENKDARCYINYAVGNLIMVSNVHEMNRYSQAITKEGMLYRGYITRYLNPNTEKPFIGNSAREKQKEKYQKQGEDLKREFQKISVELSSIKDLKDLINKINLPYMSELLKYVKESMTLESTLEDLREKKKHLSMTGVNDLRHEYEEIMNGIRVLNQKKSAKQIDLGQKKQAIDSLNGEILLLFDENKFLSQELEKTELEHVDYKNRTQELFNSHREEGMSAKEIESYYNKELTEQLSSIKSLESGLQLCQVNYISKYNRPFGTGYDRVQEYLDEQDKLVRSELVKYENKVRESREEAEKLFKEDFLSKLRSYILEAQDEISKINETLSKIKFGNDSYQFIFPKSKEFGAIYDMIVGEIKDSQEYSVFNEEFEKKYNQELDELFQNLSSDETNSTGIISKYTDYRTYMDYDIKVTSGDDVFLFSNIAKEKSGGETQIPFYVAILASFVRLFDRAEKNGMDDSVGLIIFDEVFEKMDPQRTDAMMEFISKLKVQILFACPPERLQTLSKHIGTSIAVLRQGKQAATFITQSK